MRKIEATRNSGSSQGLFLMLSPGVFPWHVASGLRISDLYLNLHPDVCKEACENVYIITQLL